MAISKFIQKICDDIQVKSGLKINREQRTQPRMEWITDRQLSEMKAISLRTAEQTKNEEILCLQQFNPSFFVEGGNKIHCRAPKCSATTKRLDFIPFNEKVRQDLFLCDEHRAMVTREVSERYGEKNIIVDPARFKNEDFDGYTVLIGELEKAFTYLQNKWFMESVTDPLLAEVFLNTRNFLMITNALLNPDTRNTITVLGPYLEMFQSYLKDPHFWQSKVTALKEMMDILLSFFGVIYRWVVVTKPTPGTRLGAGLGLLAGFAFSYALPPARLVTGLLVGFFGGGLAGSGGYEWFRDQQQIQMQQNYYKSMFLRFGLQVEMLPRDLIYASANASGDLVIHVLSGS